MIPDGFLIVRCAPCGRDVLACHDLDDDGNLEARCIHCDALVATEQARQVSVEELREWGYLVEGQQDPHGERGCRDGGCGVRQPDS